MLKKLILLSLMFLICYSVLAMEENKIYFMPQLLVRSIINYFYSKVATNAQSVKNSEKLEAFACLHFLPDELLLQILTYVSSGISVCLNIDANLRESIAGVNNFRLVSKRFNILVNDKAFIRSILNYWSKKYNIPKAHIALLWNISGAKEWITFQEKSALDIKPVTPFSVNEFTKSFEGFNDTPIFLAIALRQRENIPLLIEKGVEVNQYNVDGRSVLSKTIESGHFTEFDKLYWLDTIKFLIKNGADINAKNQDTDGDTPLVTCIRYFKLPSKILRLLLKSGAEVNKSSSECITTLTVAQLGIELSTMDASLVTEYLRKLELFRNYYKRDYLKH